MMLKLSNKKTMILIIVNFDISKLIQCTMKAKINYFSMALLIAFLLLGCTSDDADNSSSASFVPQAPVGAKIQYLDIGSTLADIVVDGENINWYYKSDEIDNEVESEEDNGVPKTIIVGASTMTWLSADTRVKNGVTYYATQTVNNVQSPTFLPVTVYVYLR